jgi:hypothetical protein
MGFVYRWGMTAKAPTRRSNAELAQDALAKARLYRARAREEERRAAADFGLWVRALAARGDVDATELCTRWDARATARGKAKPGRDAARPAKVAHNWPVARRWSPPRARYAPRRNSAAPTSTPATAPWMTASRPRRKPSDVCEPDGLGGAVERGLCVQRRREPQPQLCRERAQPVHNRGPRDVRL